MPNLRPIYLVVGALLLALAVLMTVPALVEASAESGEWRSFVASAFITGFCGAALVLVGRGDEVRYSVREGFILTNACWIATAGFAALPLSFRGDLSYVDAFFETISGLTTTGATVLVGLDALPPGILLWRSLLQWIGGVGIVLMAILILPFLRVGGMQLFRAESSDRSEKVVPRPFQLAVRIGWTYLSLTVACAFAYAVAGMSLFDAVNHAMTTLSTGGYSTHDASLGHFEQPAIHWIAICFMALGALPFVLYIGALRGNWRSLWRDQQVRAFLRLLLAVSLVLTVWLWLAHEQPLASALRLAAFNVTSIVTTTGYSTADYSAWGGFPLGLFLLLLFVGGCTGSTSGAIKIFRHQVLILMAHEQLRRLLLPHGSFPRRYNGAHVPDDIIPSVLAFLAVYMIAVFMLTLGLSFYGLDLVTSFSGAASAISNVGPGLGPVIGPAGSYASLPDGAKWLLSLGMLLGRLELFTVLVILMPTFWRM